MYDEAYSGGTKLLARAEVGSEIGSTGGFNVKPGDRVENVQVVVGDGRTLPISVNTVESPTTVAAVAYRDSLAGEVEAGTGVFSGIAVASAYLARVAQQVHATNTPGWEVIAAHMQDGTLSTYAAAAARGEVLTRNPSIGDQVRSAGVNPVDVVQVSFDVPVTGPPPSE